MNLSRLRFVLAGVLLGTFVLGIANAQQPDAPKPPKLRFLFLDETQGAYFVKVDETYHQVSANPYEISAPFTPATTGSIDLYKDHPAPDLDAGKTARVKIASVTPPADATAAIVVVTPRPPADATTAPVYAVELIASDPSDFPPGSLRIINRGQVSMAARFGTSDVITPAGETRVIRPTTDARHRSFFKIAVQLQQSGGWELLQDSLVIIRPDERMIGILVYSPGGMKHMLTPGELFEFGAPKPGHFWLTCTDRP
jgi:hypothetical protein